MEYKGQLGIAEAFTIRGYGVVRVIYAPSLYSLPNARRVRGIQGTAGPTNHIHWHSKDKAELCLATVTDAVVSRLRGDPALPETTIKIAPALIPMLKHLGKWDAIRPCQLDFQDKPVCACCEGTGLIGGAGINDCCPDCNGTGHQKPQD